jgi:hypothetical protein
MYHCGDQLSGIGGVKRPGIVHRLDRGTSGAMMVAKTDRAHAGLAAQLPTAPYPAPMQPSHSRYLCPWWVPSTPDWAHRGNRLKMTVGGADARASTTHYHVTDRFGEDFAALVECKLETGVPTKFGSTWPIWDTVIGRSVIWPAVDRLNRRPGPSECRRFPRNGNIILLAPSLTCPGHSVHSPSIRNRPIVPGPSPRRF